MNPVTRRYFIARMYFNDGTCFKAPVLAINVDDATKKSLAVLRDTYSNAELRKKGYGKLIIKSTNAKEGGI